MRTMRVTWVRCLLLPLRRISSAAQARDWLVRGV
jgi:hypothetical protein